MGSSSSAGAASKELASKLRLVAMKLLETHWFSMAKTMGKKQQSMVRTCKNHGKNHEKNHDQHISVVDFVTF
jgi:hypothetical protein